MNTRLIGLLLLFGCGWNAGLCAQSEKLDLHDSSRWQPDLERFQQADQQAAPQPGQVLFVGSSSIRLWPLDRSFPDLKPINRGFGGSQIADSVQHMEVLVLKHHPRMVVMYAGDNDLAAGKSPERVFADFAEFVAILRKRLPESRLCFIAIKPSIARWNLVDRVRRSNSLIRSYCEQHPQLEFADIFSPMLNEKGQPRPELFVDDGLHLNDKGYALWQRVLQPLLVPEGK